jgi:hypothetical protein
MAEYTRTQRIRAKCHQSDPGDHVFLSDRAIEIRNWVIERGGDAKTTLYSPYLMVYETDKHSFNAVSEGCYVVLADSGEFSIAYPDDFKEQGWVHAGWTPTYGQRGPE